MHIFFITTLLGLLLFCGFSSVEAQTTKAPFLDKGYASCPNGNPPGGVCKTCTGNFPVPCSKGGCMPSGYDAVTYCSGGTNDTAVACVYCPSGYTATGSCSKSISGNGAIIISSVTCTFSSSTSSSSSSSGCFASSEVLTLESGSVVKMDEVQVGDKIMVSSKDGKTSFSPVIVIPHPVNSVKDKFIHLTTESGRDIKMTANHLIMGGTCGGVYSLRESVSLSVGDCVVTITGKDVIRNIKTIDSFGIYTVVTASDEYLVVNGIVVSPFASNHMVANNFYNIHRVIYKFAPYIASHSIYAKAVKAFGDIIDVLSN